MFRYFVGIVNNAIAWTLDEKLKDMYLNPEVAARCYSEGFEMAKELYGNSVHMPGLTTPPISYIHLTTLGASLQFPEYDGEPNIRPVSFSSIDQAIEVVEKPVNFAECEWVRNRLDFAKKMEEILGRHVNCHLGVEGPITSAVPFYGMDFYVELLEKPEKSKRFLKAMTDSIVEFIKFTRQIQGQPLRSPSHGICDDLSSLIGPSLWDEFVLSFWNQIYEAFDATNRHLHCENLTEAHLPFLNKVSLNHFDPSHAPALHPSMLKRHLKMSWRWRVQNIHINAGHDVVRKVMEDAVRNGATMLTFYVGKGIYPEHVDFFIRTAEELGGEMV